MITILKQSWQFIQDPKNQFGLETQKYLQLCIVAIVASLVIAIFLGIVTSRNATFAFLAANVSGLFRAIPIIAFFALTLSLPFFNLGIGFKPAVISLIVLGIPPILLNTIAGLRGIDPAIVDAARGMGMTPLQVLGRVQLPLVIPVIAAGARTSGVQIVATAPLATIIGAGGYGDYIQAGIGLQAAGIPELLAGVIPVILLALLTEFGLAGVQRLLTPIALRTGALGTSSDTASGKGVVASS